MPGIDKKMSRQQYIDLINEFIVDEVYVDDQKSLLSNPKIDESPVDIEDIELGLEEEKSSSGTLSLQAKKAIVQQLDAHDGWSDIEAKVKKLEVLNLIKTINTNGKYREISTRLKLDVTESHDLSLASLKTKINGYLSAEHQIKGEDILAKLKDFKADWLK